MYPYTSASMLDLGQAANLVLGLGGSGSAIWSLPDPPSEALRCFAVGSDTTPVTGDWQPLRVTLHRSAQSVAQQLCPYSVEPLFFDGPGFDVDVSRLVDDSATAGRIVGELLGRDIKSGEVHLLFELCRVEARSEHEVTANPPRQFFDRRAHLEPDWRRASARLRPGRRLRDGSSHDAAVTAEQAQAYLDAFARYGTHFVSAIELGERLFQLVRFAGPGGRAVADQWQRLGGADAYEGQDASLFGAFLGQADVGDVGPLRTHNGSHIAAACFVDPMSPSGESLVAGARVDQSRALGQLAEPSVTRVELNSLGRFMEFYRAHNYDRVLRGAMMQRWGDRVAFPLRRLPSVERDRQPLAMLDDVCGADVAPGRCDRTLSITGTVALDEVRIVGLVDCPSMTTEAATVIVAATEFDRMPIVCESMAGAFWITTTEGSQRDAVVDGLRFTSVESSTGIEVRVAGDLHRGDPAQIEAMTPELWSSVARIAATLDVAPPGSRAADAAASFARWLGNTVSVENTVSCGNAEVALAATYLGRVRAPLNGYSADLRDRGFRRRRFDTSALTTVLEAAETGQRVRSADLSDRLEVLADANDAVSAQWSAAIKADEAVRDQALTEAGVAREQARSALINELSKLPAVVADGDDAMAAARELVVAEMRLATTGERPAKADDLDSMSRDKAVEAALRLASRERALRSVEAEIVALNTLLYDLGNDDVSPAGACVSLDALSFGSGELPVADTDVLGVVGDRGLAATWRVFDDSRTVHLLLQLEGSRVVADQWFRSLFAEATAKLNTTESAVDSANLRLVASLATAFTDHFGHEQLADLDAPGIGELMMLLTHARRADPAPGVDPAPGIQPADVPRELCGVPS